jgi:hypothetical protein
VYLCHPELIKCFYMDGSHNKLFDNLTSMVSMQLPPRSFCMRCCGCCGFHPRGLLTQPDASQWGPNVPREEWPAEGRPGGESAHIMESRCRGGIDQSYSMVRCAAPRCARIASRHGVAAAHELTAVLTCCASRPQLYPNVFWNRYGSWFSVTHVTPTSPDTCLTTFDLFFKPGALDDAAFISQCIAAEDELQKQDIELCMRVGENLRNPLYKAGRYAPIEAPMWFFHQLLNKDIFGTSPGLVHRPVGSNRNFFAPPPV